jgi:hypothetical protein
MYNYIVLVYIVVPLDVMAPALTGAFVVFSVMTPRKKKLLEAERNAQVDGVKTDIY